MRDPCNEKGSKIFCQKSDKFSNLVLTFGQMNDKTYGYIAYRLKDDQTLERVTDGIPWNLKTKGGEVLGWQRYTTLRILRDDIR